MININLAPGNLTELLKHHANYIKETVPDNWEKMVGKPVDKQRVTPQELEEIASATNEHLSKFHTANQKNLFLENIVQICTTKDLNTYAIPTETLFPTNTNRYRNILLKIIGYDNFSKGIPQEENTNGISWNRHMLIDKLNVRVCPYCNRQYITSFYKNDVSTATADIDHYFPKSQYPLLSMSFFNLVPSCTVCNSRLKGGKIINQENKHLHPLFDDSDCLFFSTNNDTLEELYNFPTSKTEIKVTINQEKDPAAQKRTGNSIETFHLSELYCAHTKEVDTIRKNINHFSKEYFNNVFQKNYGELFETYEDFEKVIFHFNYIDDSDEPLTKLKKDIYRQLFLN